MAADAEPMELGPVSRFRRAGFVEPRRGCMAAVSVVIQVSLRTDMGSGCVRERDPIWIDSNNPREDLP